ncbi:MAG TPA: hypothetical protein P5149_05440 [Candidatus Competibacteraceae bacterium]|nr:hypothetical protein [Candidatus Competibacteraceae bacterium]MCP5133268.1 hypothetical protein [Gammaproteobacteria bacterium]HPF57319.1 hypothetical protein [Candidatus Competibacteraceae bacterium]HRY17832.1 hypothetical protein [Candidatus Competibacteraceae bacterium]
MAFRILQSLFSRTSQPGKFDKELMLQAIERVVDGTDPRLRAVSHYRRKLWGAVEHAIDFVVNFVNALPPAIVADRQGYMTDPRLRALFASPEHLREILSFSDGTQNYLKQTSGPLPVELYAGLGAVRIEKNTFGIEMDGEILRRDVPQTTVSFCSHRLVFLTGNEQDTRREFMKRAADYLIETALQRLTASRIQKTQLEQQQRKLLQQKAGLLKKAQIGFESLAGPATAEPADLNTLERQLQDLETELNQLRADPATLDKHLATVAATLSEPEKYLTLEPASLTLDHTNTKVPADSPRIANTLTFQEIVIAKNQRVAALFVRFPSSELLPQPDFFKEAQRLLHSVR